jgi:hypothetical protein
MQIVRRDDLIIIHTHRAFRGQVLYRMQESAGASPTQVRSWAPMRVQLDSRFR